MDYCAHRRKRQVEILKILKESRTCLVTRRKKIDLSVDGSPLKIILGSTSSELYSEHVGVEANGISCLSSCMERRWNWRIAGW